MQDALLTCANTVIFDTNATFRTAIKIETFKNVNSQYKTVACFFCVLPSSIKFM